MIRRIRRSIKQTRTEQDYRQRYAIYRTSTDKPMSYRQWVAEQKAPKQEES